MLAKDGERKQVSKSQALLAFRRVAPVVGVKPGDIMLLDTLAAFTRPSDWEEGARPIVWPSNEYLIQNTGYSLSAVKRRLRNLAEMGLIAYKDSSNGKRWGRRDENERIVEAYGFDLSPMAARVGEFEALYASVRAERDLQKTLKRKITILRRIISAILESDFAYLSSAFWLQIRQRYEALLEALRTNGRGSEELSKAWGAFDKLKDDAEEALRNLEPAKPAAPISTDCNIENNSRVMDPTGTDFGPHIHITNDLQIVKSNGIENAPADLAPAEQRHQAKRLVDTGNAANPSREIERGAASIEPRRSVGDVTIPSVVFACPAFAEMARGVGAYIRNWSDFVTVADKIRPMIGISGDAWTAARAAMGSEVAAVAIALITDKYSEGKLASPGGYLRGLCIKAQKGDLNLARSVFGRMKERQAKAGD